jgi:(4-(4-[2-(gamma-L-glutamylamino)ethyl]phenoxymethyl)furan-2-yl)methanamine synthase
MGPPYNSVMGKSILGLDIGGANLKAATPEGTAMSVPFPVWKHPERLRAELANLIDRFPNIDHLAITMTAELCDCYETKRIGVNRILDDVIAAARGKTISIWSTSGKFVDDSTARRDWMTVAAANWHALATFAARYTPDGNGLLIDMGSTTTDIIPIRAGRVATRGLTDHDRLRNGELVYMGIKRTPLCALGGNTIAREFFATAEDAHMLLGFLPERPDADDTADGRGMTRPLALHRLARMLGGDAEVIPEDEIIMYAKSILQHQSHLLLTAINSYMQSSGNECIITSGVGEYFIIDTLQQLPHQTVRSLNTILGEQVSSAAPAYAVATLQHEYS